MKCSAAAASLIGASLMGMAGLLRADVKLPAIFGNHMVLQQGATLPVWGTADPGEKVTVTVGAEEADATADATGKWMVKLTPLPNGAAPTTMRVYGDKNMLTFHDVVAGDVWICSGQSNMEFRLAQAQNAVTELPKATDPQLRLFLVQHKASPQPETDVVGSWQLCTPDTAKNFSAVGYFFGRELRTGLTRPIGLIESCWGDAPAQAFTSLSGLQQASPFTDDIEAYQKFADDYSKARNDYPAALAAYRDQSKQWNSTIAPTYDAAMKQWQDTVVQAHKSGQPAPPRPVPSTPMPRAPSLPEGPPGTPTVLYNGMIAPLIPYAIKGVIWYQGESNADNGLEYQTLFTRMISDWREKWGEGNFPFLFVQLASYDHGPVPDWPYLREAQLKTLALPNTGMASAVDLGDFLNPKNIDPFDKLDVGLRLALAAKHVAYGQNLVYSGPIYNSFTMEGNAIQVNFTQTGGGLVIGRPPWIDPAAPPWPTDKLTGFEIAGANGIYAPADARIEGDSVVVTNSQIEQPVFVRFGWSNVVQTNLYNKEGLPAAPFRTDNQPPQQLQPGTAPAPIASASAAPFRTDNQPPQQLRPGTAPVPIASASAAPTPASPLLLSSDGHQIVSLDIDNHVPGLPVMTFYVRYPQGFSPKDKVEGVFADVTWLTEKKNLEKWVERPSSADPNFQFADQHKLVIVTWTTATMYSISDSFTDDPDEERDPNNSMEDCFRTWKVGMDQLCRDYNLPDNGFLIYGASRGAQWAHRIVLRSPEKFLAVHIHINSSYEEPTPEASHCLWLLTTGELEHGNKAARIFFHKAQALNYPILLRIYPGKAHEVFPEEVTLGLKFFDYVLKLKDRQLKIQAAQQTGGVSSDDENAPLVLDDFLLGDFRKPPYYGDMLNGDVYPASQIAILPESQRVGIPNLDIARTWGYSTRDLTGKGEEENVALEQTRFTVFGLNPNDVATFIVVLILSLPILLKWSKHWLWFVWPVETGFIALLVGTGSRGGVLALICGLIIAKILCWRMSLLPKNWRIWASIGLAVILGVGAGLAVFPKGFRLGTVDVSPEASAGRRLEVWSTVPAMLASAPNGWGLGNSAQAYEQWFEPVGEDVELKHLLSSHFTWLVEFGWPLRWLYLFFWMTALALVLPSRKFSFPIWGVAIWTAFLVALFYNAAGKWWNWPLPTLWLLAALILRCSQKTFPAGRYWILSVLISGFIVGLPFIVFRSQASATSVRALDGGNVVLIGTGKPAIAILSPSEGVLGDFYGQDIRKEWSKAGQEAGSVIIVKQPDASASSYLSDCQLYVLSGGDETAWDKWKSIFKPNPEAKLFLINCRVPVDDGIKVFSRVVYCHGEFYGDPHYNEWQEFSAAHPAVSVQDIPRHEAYIADWWPLLNEATAK